MKVTYALSSGTIPAKVATKLDVLITFEAYSTAGVTRRPLNLSVVLDRSGSMAGHPLRYAIQAAIKLVDALKPDDRVSVVVYDDKADTIVSSQVASNKKAIFSAIERVRAGGCTNLSGGWLLGCSHVKAHQSPEQVNRVLLLTDGQANMGITDPSVLISTAKQKADEGIGTTTLGFGGYFNEDLLIGMARAAEGNFYFIQSPDDAEDVFKIEVEGLSNVVGQNLIATMKPEGDAQVVSLLNEYKTDRKGDAIQVTIGDVYAIEGKMLAVEVNLPAINAGGQKTLATLTYTYQSVVDGAIQDLQGEIPIVVNVMGDEVEQTEAAPDMAVVAEASKLRIAKVKEETVQLADNGDLQGAAAKLRQVIEQLRTGVVANSFEIAEELDQLDYYAQKLEKRSYDGVIRKELRDQSYQAANRRRDDLALRGTTAGSASGLEAISKADKGVIVKCERQGGKLRVRVVSEGFDANKNVQFPRAVREAGMTYLVDDVLSSADGSFYRVSGKIRLLVQPGQERAAGKTSSPTVSGPAKGVGKPQPVKVAATAKDLETTTEVGDCVLVQCVKEGSKLRARVVSDGYNPDWNIRFPRSIREEGVLYVVDEVVETSGGGSYMAGGKVRRLVQ